MLSSPKVDGEPLEPNSVDEGEVEVVVAEVEGESLEPNSVNKDEVRSRRRSRNDEHRARLIRYRMLVPWPHFSPSCPGFVMEAT